jgi:hypothetical protein
MGRQEAYQIKHGEVMSLQDMPVFVIKGKDKFALRLLITHRDLCIANGLIKQSLEDQKAIDELVDWQDENPELMKFPDHKHIPVGETPVVDITPDPRLAREM